MDPVAHSELASDDLERAKAFYSTAFGWDIEETPFADDVYRSVVTSPVDEEGGHEERGAINGAIIERERGLTAPIVTITVPSVDDHISKIDSAGGTIVDPKGEVPHTGFYACFEDTEGNVIGLWDSVDR